jgi:hypothetical protein
LSDKGIAYTCNCPRFMHYHTCKHVVALGLHFEKVVVPERYSIEVTLAHNPNPSTTLTRAHSNPTSPLH